MDSRIQALEEIARLARAHQLTADEITAAVSGTTGDLRPVPDREPRVELVPVRPAETDHRAGWQRETRFQ